MLSFDPIDKPTPNPIPHPHPILAGQNDGQNEHTWRRERDKTADIFIRLHLHNTQIIHTETYKATQRVSVAQSFKHTNATTHIEKHQMCKHTQAQTHTLSDICVPDMSQTPWTRIIKAQHTHALSTEARAHSQPILWMAISCNGYFSIFRFTECIVCYVLTHGHLNGKSIFMDISVL